MEENKAVRIYNIECWVNFVETITTGTEYDKMKCYFHVSNGKCDRDYVTGLLQNDSMTLKGNLLRHTKSYTAVT